MWTQAQLGEFLGVYVCKGRCMVISRWENGWTRPLPVFQHKMNQLVTDVTILPIYLKERRRIREKQV